MSEKAKGGFNIKYVHFAITFALMFLFRFIPPFGTVTPYGMALIGIFIGLIYSWTVDADNLCWGSLMGIVALGVTDFGNAGIISGCQHSTGVLFRVHDHTAELDDHKGLAV